MLTDSKVSAAVADVRDRFSPASAKVAFTLRVKKAERTFGTELSGLVGRIARVGDWDRPTVLPSG